MDDRDVADAIWAGRTDRLYAFRSLLDAGATLAFGSDAPVSPLDPWVTIEAAVTRSREEREPWHPEQRITPEEALEASTRSRVAEGEVGDVIAVENDPLGYAVRGMPVALTLVSGRVTHTTL
jgi:predicted amidohydrolase YtcJ